MYLLLGLILLVALLALPLACTATILPPEEPGDPVPAFVIVQAWTSSLVLPAPDEGLVRYAYGDWHYYALGEDTVPNGIRALLWPSQATLGRAALSGPASVDRLRAIVNADEIHEIAVSRDAAVRLVRALDATYASRRGTEVVNEAYGMRFVHHGASYTYFHNSNHVVAGWLRQLGCEVRGPTFGSTWRVEQRR